MTRLTDFISYRGLDVFEGAIEVACTTKDVVSGIALRASSGGSTLETSGLTVFTGRWGRVIVVELV
jgi:hypothetical protein